MKVVFSVFTDCYSVKVPVPEEKLKSSAKVISCMLKSWPGKPVLLPPPPSLYYISNPDFYQGFWHCQCTTCARHDRWLMHYLYPLQVSGTLSWSCFLISLELSRHRGRLVSSQDEGLPVRDSRVLGNDIFPKKTVGSMLTQCTAYGRVTNLKSESCAKPTRSEGDANHGNLVDHFTALLLAVFFEAGLLKVCFPS